MKRHKQKTNSRTNDIYKRISSSWGTLIAGLTIFSMGFATGIYISKLKEDIALFRQESQYQEERRILKEKYQNEIYLLRKENFELQKTILQDGRKKQDYRK